MKKQYVLIIAIAICLSVVGVAYTQLPNDIQLHKSCSRCGMDRGMFDFSRMLLEYDGGTTVAVCSLHCAAIDMANNIDKTPKSIMVADFKEKKLIGAEKAFWVVGGKKPGVMSRKGKWAFEKKDDAENFMNTNEGNLVTFDQAIKLAYEDMYEDTKMIREKRMQKRLKMMDNK